jgi:hypothetical protein
MVKPRDEKKVRRLVRPARAMLDLTRASEKVLAVLTIAQNEDRCKGNPVVTPFQAQSGCTV